MSVEGEVLGLLAALGGVLDRRKARWFLFGGQAAILHGSPRLTLDVDVTAEVEIGAVGALLAELLSAGFRPRVDDPAAFVERTRVLPLLHEASGLPVDLVIAGPGLEQEFLSRARRVEAGGASFPLVTAEDFVVMKILAGRPKDLEDVTAVLAQERPFDRAHVVAKLRQLEAALDRSDLVTLFESLAAR